MPTCTIPMKDCPSSIIRRYGYDPQRQTLAVQFITGADRTATTRPYEYTGVTPEQFDALEAAESKGTHINANFVRNKEQPFTKIVETDEERAARKQGEAKAA